MRRKDTILILDDDCSAHEAMEEVFTRDVQDAGLRFLCPRFTDPGEEADYHDSFFRNEKRLAATVDMINTERARIGLLVLDTSMPDIDLQKDFGSLQLNRLPLWLWSIMDYGPKEQLELMEYYANKGFNNFENFITKNHMRDHGMPMILERFKKL